jgi:hypothetical protein
MYAIKDWPYAQCAIVGPLMSFLAHYDWGQGSISLGWNPTTEAHVWSTVVVMLNPLMQHHSKVLFAQWN